MTFGEALKTARASHGWSQERLFRTIKARFSGSNVEISIDTIKSIEAGRVKDPRLTTKALLKRVLPELNIP